MYDKTLTSEMENEDGIEQCHKVAFVKGRETFLKEVDEFNEMSVEKYLNETTVSPQLYHSLNVLFNYWCVFYT